MTEPIKCLLHKSNIVSRMILLASVGVLIAGPAWSYEGVSAEVLVKTGETIVGETIVYPETGAPVVEVAVVTIAPGEKTILHQHGVPMIAYILEGELSVYYEGIGLKIFKQGSSYVETMHVDHFGENATDRVLKVLVVYAGAKGSENVIPASR